jgi:hypothetical protein
MKNYQIPYFGEIDITNLEDYYEMEVTIHENKVSLDLNFEDTSDDENTFQDIKNFLENLDRYGHQNKLFIENDFNGNGNALDYVNFYLEEFDQEELSAIIDLDGENGSREKQLLNKLVLIRVGLYPDESDDSNHFAIFDYSILIDGEACNQLLVVITNKAGELNYITWES